MTGGEASGRVPEDTINGNTRRGGRVFLDLYSELPSGRLAGVVAYLEFLVERGLVSGETSRRALRAANILRKAVDEEAKSEEAEVI